VRPDFEELHDQARHARHLVESETVAIETMERMIMQQNVNFELLRSRFDTTYPIQSKEYMEFQLQMMKSLRSRAQATLDRLNGEVTLVSWLGSTFPQKKLKQWQAYNSLASNDNRIMKSITILAMVFLPATFVAVSCPASV
jgi:Mg2+ and Co2+ transporter CorA